MAARKKKQPVEGGADALRTIAVVIEEMNAKFNVFGEGLQALREEMDARFTAMDQRFDAVDRRFDAVDLRFAGIDARLDGIDARLDGIDARLDGIDARLDSLDERLGRVESDVSLVKLAVLDNGREIKGLRRMFEDLDARKADRSDLPAG